MHTSNKELLIKLIDDVWSQGNLDIVEELVAPLYTLHHDPGDPLEGQTIDIATFKNRVQQSRNIFPDQKFHILEFICEENKIAISWNLTGTQRGEIPGILPATNKPINVSGLTIYYFKEGKITGHWQVFDKLGLINQLRS